MLRRAVALISLLPALAPAQARGPGAGDGPVQALQQRLLSAAALDRTAFTAEWQWPGTETRLAGRAPLANDTATGAFYTDALRVKLDRKQPAEVLQHGRHTMLRLGDGDWRLANARGDLGVPFVPDPQLLLRLLANGIAQIGDRCTSERDGRGVELFALTLAPAQVADLVFAGALLDPQPLPGGLRAMMEQRGVPESELPTATVDVGLEFDAATGHLLRLRVRCLVAPTDTARIRQLAGGRAAVEAPAVDPATPAQPAATPAPLRYEDGMPVRETEGLQQRTLELRLSEHGTAPALLLDARQRRLLGRD